MKKILFFIAVGLISLVLFGCSSAQNIIYYPDNGSEQWNISVKHTSGFGRDYIDLQVNGEKIAALAISFSSHDEQTVKYKNEELRVTMDRNMGFFTEDYIVHVFRKDKLLGRFEF